MIIMIMCNKILLFQKSTKDNIEIYFLLHVININIYNLVIDL